MFILSVNSCISDERRLEVRCNKYKEEVERLRQEKLMEALQFGDQFERVLKILVMNKPVFSPADKMQKRFVFLRFSFTEQWDIVIPWVLKSESCSDSPLLKTIFCPDLWSLFPVIFCLLRHFSGIRASVFRDTIQPVQINKLCHY